MASALRKIGIPVAMQSESDLKGDNPAYAWLAALCTIVIERTGCTKSGAHGGSELNVIDAQSALGMSPMRPSA